MKINLPIICFLILILNSNVANADKRFLPNKEQEIYCLAEAIFFESRGEIFKGKQAVAAVIFNRIKDGSFGNTICSVVNQGCQFSYKCLPKSNFNPPTHYSKFYREQWKDHYLLAKLYYSDYTNHRFIDPTLGAIYYHTHTVKPLWNRYITIEYTTDIGNHRFYRKRIGIGIGK